MKRFVLAGLTCAGLLALSEPARAHGGQYRGPTDVTPPSPGGGRGTGGPGGPSTGGPSGPSTPGPAGPSTPGPSGPATGGPAGPAPSRGPATGRGGITIEDNLSSWLFWWEFNKDPYIRLKAAIHSGGIATGSDDFFLGATRRVDASNTLKPSDEDKMTNILPALKKAIDSTRQRDINSSCMVAMAKIGRDHTDFKLADVFTPRLKESDQEIRETAALAFGIAALPHKENLEIMIALATDSAQGKDLSGGGNVNDRTRAFATYGLGLVAWSTADVGLKRQVFEALKPLVDDEKFSNRNIKVAAINAIGLLKIADSDDAGKALLADALKTLEDYYTKNLGSGEQLIQAHCPPAIAKLLHKDHEKTAYYKEMFAADLSGKSKVKRSSDEITRSCVLALGQLCKPVEKKEDADAKYLDQLLTTWNDHKDPQTRYFSILAYAQIGGATTRDVLKKAFDKARKSVEKPWVALAMGVQAFHKQEAEKAAGRSPEPEREYGSLLRDALKDVKDPESLGGIAIGLGLCRYTDASDDVRAMLLDSVAKEELAGYLCIALALMDDKRSIQDIQNVVDMSKRRTGLLQQAAVALGKLGDKSVADKLQAMLSDGEPNLAKLSAIASALGYIGDRRTIEPLKKILFDEKLGELPRAFAAVALGGVGDKEDLPWNSKIGANMNYRAAVETLTDRTAGILDIL